MRIAPFRALLQAAAWIVVLTASPAAADLTRDPCRDLFAIDQDGGKASWRLLSLIGLGPEKPSEAARSGGFGDSAYYVTIRAGRFANVSCDSNRFEHQEMYPLGVVVRPLYPLDPAAYGRAVPGTPVLVLTEFGHRKIVALENLQPITPNATYIFADSYARTMLCRAPDDCPGNAEDICDDARCKYMISAKFGYAVAGNQNPDFARARAGYDQLSGDALILQTRDLDPATQARAMADACTPFPVRAMKRGGLPHQPRDSYLSLCSQRKDHGAPADGYAPLKLVDLDYAAHVFSYGHNGSFHRSLSGDETLLNTALATFGSIRLTAVKNCGQALKSSGTLTFGGGISIKLDTGLIEIASKVETTLKQELQTIYGTDDFLLFSTYLVQPFPNGPAGDTAGSDTAQELWLFRVVFRSICDNGSPKKSGSIIVHYDRLPGEMVEIDAQTGLTRSFTQKWDNLSLVPKCDANFLRLGQFWQIRDHIGYFIWRDVLRDYFYGLPGAYDLLTTYPTQQQPLVRDFFIHLMLAAAFHHLDPEKPPPPNTSLPCS